MFTPQVGNFPFATTKDKQDNSISNNLANRTMETDIGAGDSNQSLIDKTKLIVNYIPQFATEDDLALIFAPIGRVESVKIMRDYKTGYSFGFGFVKYSTPEDASRAIEMLNGYNFRNKRLKVSYSRPPGTDMKDSNLYVTNLPKDITERQIDHLFRDYGDIVQRTILKDKVTGMPRGVAFVRYSKGEEAQAAIANLHGKMLENAMLPLSVRVAEDHGRQKAQYVDVWDPMGFNREPEEEEGPDPEEILISAVSCRRPLWDCTLPLIERSQIRIETLWREIVDTFNGTYSLEFLIKKWRQLKDDYTLAHNKVTSYIPHGPGDHAPTPTFPYYNHMRFLDSVDNMDRQKDNLFAKPYFPLSTQSQFGSNISSSEPITISELEGPKVKKFKVDDKDSVDGFLVLIGESLRNLPLKNRTKVQIKILQLLDDEQCSLSE